VLEAETKIETAKLKEKRQYTEGRDAKKQTAKNIDEGQLPTKMGAPKHGAFFDEVAKKWFYHAPSKVQRKSRVFVGKDGKIYKQDYNFDPNKGTESNAGEAYESKLPGMPFDQKVALKKTSTPTAEANVKLSKERLELQKQQELVKRQGRSLDAEQMILGNPEDPRSPVAVQQFQQNASQQPYMYITRETERWFGGKKIKAEKIQLPSDKEGKQITAQDIKDTLKANPKKFRNIQDVLKALGAM